MCLKTLGLKKLMLAHSWLVIIWNFVTIFFYLFIYPDWKSFGNNNKWSIMAMEVPDEFLEANSLLDYEVLG